MKQAISKHLRDFVALILLFVVSLGVGGYILGHQRFYLPNWVPVLGSDFVDYKAEFSTGKSLTPGRARPWTSRAASPSGRSATCGSRRAARS